MLVDRGHVKSRTKAIASSDAIAFVLAFRHHLMLRPQLSLHVKWFESLLTAAVPNVQADAGSGPASPYIPTQNLAGSAS
jgi:hypothetical protein